MSIDIDAEDLIPFCEARSAFPGGKRLSLATLHRRRLHGVRGTHLEAVLIGGSRYTSAEAISRFIRAQNVTDSPVAAISLKQRRRQAASANRVLQEAGL